MSDLTLVDVTELSLDKRCAAGLNTACVDCGDVPLFGGKRCHACFLTVRERRLISGEHKYSDRVPSLTTYQYGCRCSECKEHKRASDARYRKPNG